jgi:hypothetical protein
MKKTNQLMTTIETVAVLGLALILGACTQRSPIPLYDGTLTSALTCSAYVNPSPVQVTVDGAGNISGAQPTVTIAVAPSQAAQIVSMVVSNSAGLQMNTSLAIPTPLQSQFSLQAKAIAATANSVTFQMQDSSRNTASCVANITFQTTTAAPTPGALKFQMAADVNGDMINDQIAFDGTTGYWWVMLTGNATSGAYQNWGIWGANQNWQNVTMVDINGDKKFDIVGRDLNTGNWWAAVSSGSSFSNLFLGYWNTQMNWTNIRFGLDANGVMSVFGTDSNGIQYSMALNNTQGGTGGVLTPLPPVLTIGVSATFGGTPASVASIPFGANAYVSWQALSASGCIVYTGTAASPTVHAQGNSGTAFLMNSLQASTTVYLGCNGAGTSQTAPASAQIQVGSAPTPVLSLSAPQVAALNATVPVVWAATNVTANSCSMTANGAAIALPSNSAGSTVNSPPIRGLTTILLSCNSPAGIQTKSVPVALAALPGSSPANFQFGTVTTGSASAVQNLALTSANGITTIKEITIAPGFVAGTSSCGAIPFDVPQGGTCNVPLTFNPTAAAAYTGNVIFKYQTKGFNQTAANSPAIAVAGTGKAPCSGKKCK